MDITTLSQVCTKCHQRKLVSEFSPNASMCKPCFSEYVTNRANADKLTAMIYYSGTNPPSCQCCGETIYEFLTFDHIDGIKGKREASSGKGLATYLRSRGFPPGFQILCFNCNNAKQLYKICPHKK